MRIKAGDRIVDSFAGSGVVLQVLAGRFGLVQWDRLIGIRASIANLDAVRRVKS